MKNLYPTSSRRRPGSRIWKCWIPAFAGMTICAGMTMFVACISLPRSFHALSYKNQRVIIDQHHSYAVGPLSEEWQYLRNKKPGVSFFNKRLGANLATEALCGAAYEDLPLKMLTQHLFANLDDVQIIQEKKKMLSEREALQTQARASLDGQPVSIDTLVIKKNECLFDFFMVSPLATATESSEAFTNFVDGFSY